MIKIKLTNIFAFILMAYGIYTLWQAIQYETTWYLVWTIPTIVSAVGLFLSRSWSQYLYYLVVFFTSAGWAVFVVMAWPNISESAITRLLLLGAFLVPYSVWSSYIIFRYFRKIT